MPHRILVLLLLTLFLAPLASAFDTPTASMELQQDTLIQQTEILSGGIVLLSVIATTEQPTKAVAIVSLRWWADRSDRSIGDRLAWLRINGVFVGPPAIQDSCPTCPMQVSSNIVFLFDLPPGTHTIEVIFGGCCGLYGHPFWVGRWSRLDVIY